jgi:hypothetical protein
MVQQEPSLADRAELVTRRVWLKFIVLNLSLNVSTGRVNGPSGTEIM